ncbi:hypothetical protein Tco_1439087 [Tanacetum coccineum]
MRGLQSRPASEPCPFQSSDPALLALVEGQETISPSLDLGATQVLNSGKDFSADLERNLFKLANFLLSALTPFDVRGTGVSSTELVCQGTVLSLSG